MVYSIYLVSPAMQTLPTPMRSGLEGLSCAQAMKSVLLSFHVVLKVALFLGGFPCRFDENFELIPIKPWIFLLKYMAFFLTALGLFCLGVWNFLRSLEVGFGWDSLMKYFSLFAGNYERVMDTMTYLSSPVTAVYIAISLAGSMAFMGEALSKLETQIRNFKPFHSPTKTSAKSAFMALL